MTVIEFARLGGHARAAKMSAKERQESARKAGLARGAQRSAQRAKKIA